METTFNCMVGNYSDEMSSQQCAFEMSLRKERVYEAESTFHGFFENRTYEVVDTGCSDGAIFDSWFGSNVEDAKACADKLNNFRKLAGKSQDATFAAVPLRSCAIFADVWIVIKRSDAE